MKQLEANTWELQPLTPDLIYHFLEEGLGEEEGKDTYNKLGQIIREICSNPLLLNMLLTVRQKTSKVPMSRGGLYDQFIDLLLKWGTDGSTIKQNQKKLSELIGEKLTFTKYSSIVDSVLSELATLMETTAIRWGEAYESFKNTLTYAKQPSDAAFLLLNDLISRGILKSDGGRVSFFHHTFQEYFLAIKMKDYSVTTLIPDGGVQGSMREVIVFLSSIMDNPNKLLSRAMQFDSFLAYDIMQAAQSNITERVQLQLARKFWKKTIEQGKWVGENKRSASAFNAIATNLKQSPEQLARKIQKYSSENEFLTQLLEFYQELGNISLQKEVSIKLGKISSSSLPEKLPKNTLFRLGINATHERNYQKAIELYSAYIKRYPYEASAAYGNRANAYERLGQSDQAFNDYTMSLKLNPASAVTRTNFADFFRKISKLTKLSSNLKKH